MLAVGTVVSGLTALAANESVQAGALRLVKDVYGRIMPSRTGRASADQIKGMEQGSAPVDQGATREEMVAALAMLQAQVQEVIANTMIAAQRDADRRQRVLATLLGLVIVLQLAMLVAILWR